MNERIREFALHATHVEEPDGLFPREIFDKEKFAQLIVQECAGLCNEIGEYGEYPESEAEACAEYILKHFGVDQDNGEYSYK